MKKQRTYVFICLVSLLMFFSGPLLFLSDVLMESFSFVELEQVDLMETETESESETPLPLEEEHQAIVDELNSEFEEPANTSENEQYFFSRWKSIILSTITPPPDCQIV